VLRLSICFWKGLLSSGVERLTEEESWDVSVKPDVGLSLEVRRVLMLCSAGTS
jgi:hypothetical protein